MNSKWLAWAGAAVLLCGCETTTTSSSKPRRAAARGVAAQPDDAAIAPADDAPVEHLPVAGQVSLSPLGAENTADQALTSDISERRLGDIMAAILVYFQFNHSMPAKLEDLRTVGGIDMNVANSAGQTFVYVPSGLAMPGVRKLLVVYDPQVSADHTRWCILMSPPQSGVKPTGEVLSLKEVVIQAYLKGSQ